MIEIKNLHKSFGHVEVLKGVDVSIEEKEVVVIIGPSGSGKSTLLRCMNYLEEPTSGDITVDNMKLDKHADINKIRENIGMVFQRFNLFPHMTVLENIAFPLEIKKVKKAEREAKASKSRGKGRQEEGGRRGPNKKGPTCYQQGCSGAARANAILQEGG